ncbi:MAG TPA: hypothetical protein VHC68_00795 [Candidatus Paceibacterota bacterium]|nr:hypothetical protein [Candidatus Paceibacterota bacterium]
MAARDNVHYVVIKGPDLVTLACALFGRREKNCPPIHIELADDDRSEWDVGVTSVQSKEKGRDQWNIEGLASKIKPDRERSFQDMWDHSPRRVFMFWDASLHAGFLKFV